MKGRANAGQGGKIGHANQDHWQYTEEIKATARKWRRIQAKSETAAGLREGGLAEETEQSKRDDNDELSE